MKYRDTDTTEYQFLYLPLHPCYSPKRKSASQKLMKKGFAAFTNILTIAQQLDERNS